MLNELHRKFLDFHKSLFIKNANVWVGTENLKLNEREVEEIFENYEKSSLTDFSQRVKDILYSENTFQFVVSQATEQWKLYIYLEFLREENIISISKEGNIKLLKQELLNFLPKPLSFEEIKEQIESRIGQKLELSKPTSYLFNTEIRAEYDQMPVSLSSALLIVEKILRYIPFYEKFLFIGDDDLISLLLCLSHPKMECKVVDIDKKLLNTIREISEKFNLKIHTQETDIRKNNNLEEDFAGFFTNPSYNFAGIKEFVEFGVSRLGEKGGIALLGMGDEAIGNRSLFLEKFFAEKNLNLKEMINGKIFFPWISLHEEDKFVFEKMNKLFEKDFIENSPKLGANLWIFNYIPYQIRKVKAKESIYEYL